MLTDIKKYLGKKVYVELEKRDEEESEDRVQGGAIYKSLEEVLETASENEEFIEIEISKQFRSVNQCMAVVEVKNGKIIRKVK